MRKINFIPDNINSRGEYLCCENLSAGNIGLENNNPGNIRYNSNINWQGQVGQKNGFVDFASMTYGYRALIKNLQAYINSGTDTIRTMISKWCPPGDGCNTESYIDHVSQRTGISPNKRISANDLNSLASMAGAISISEIGTKYDNFILEAVQMLQSGATSAIQPRNQMNQGVKVLAGIGFTLLGAYLVNEYIVKPNKKRKRK